MKKHLHFYSKILTSLFLVTFFFSLAYAQPNNNCAGATLLISGTGCSNTGGTMINATASGVSGCTTPSSPDVWYKFVAQSEFPSIRLSSIGGDFNGKAPNVQLFSGSCGSFTNLGCSSTPFNTGVVFPPGLTIGTTYYIRIFGKSLTTSAASGNYNFNICIVDLSSAAVTIDYSKAFVNITDGSSGGTINTGDVLEIRATFVIGGEKYIPISDIKFLDTLQNGGGLTYKDSISTRTNEGKLCNFFTNNFNDDAGGRRTITAGTEIKINLGVDATKNMGGMLYANSNPSFYGGTCILMATYRVTVIGSNGTKINFGGGAFRYSIGSSDFTIAFPQDSLIVYQTLDACSDAVSPGNLIGNANNGTFGTLPLGSTATNALQNAGAAAINTTYTYKVFTTGGPNDYSYGIANNTSATNAIIQTAPKGDASRVFTLWDITGDHTGAADPAKGNKPCDVSKPVSNANPCGYMLAVNANFRSDVAFEYTASGVCSDTYYEVSAWFKNICYRCGCDSLGRGSGSGGYIATAAGDSSGVRPNIAMLIDGISYYTTGELVYQGLGGTNTGSDTLNNWVRKSFVFKTSPTQSNFTVTFKNNAPGGGGNDWVVDDIGLRTCYPSMVYAPTNPIVFMGQTLTITDTVRSYFPSYASYKWQRAPAATPNTFSDIPGQSGTATPVFKPLINQYEYVVAYTIPGSATQLANAGDVYRMLVASSTTNLANGCNYTPTVKFTLLQVDAPCAFTATNSAVAPKGVSIDWNKLDWSLGHVPTCCESAYIEFPGSSNVDDVVIVNITNDICIINLTLINSSTKANQLFKTVLQPTFNMQMNGNVRMGAPATFASDSCIFVAKGGGTITVNGNTVIGLPLDNSVSVFGTAPGTTSYANYVLKGDSLTFNVKALVNHKFTSILLNPTSGTTKFVNNTSTSLFTYPVTFDKLFIGNSNAKTVISSGSNQNAFFNDNGGFLDITTGSTLNLPANYSMNAKDFTTAGVFNSNLFARQSTSLILGGISGGITGSNFPAKFTNYSIDETNTVFFTGAAQTIPGSSDNVNLYGNITLQGSGIKKGSASTVTLASNLYRQGSGHTFDGNGGRFTFTNSTKMQRYFADAISSPMNFYDLTNNNTNAAGFSVDSTFGIINELELKPSTKITLNTGDIVMRSSAVRTSHVKDLGATLPGIVYNSSNRFIVERYLFGEKAWRFLATPVIMSPADPSTPTVAASWRENVSSLTSTGVGTAITGPSGPNAQLDYYTQRGSMKYYSDATNNWVELSNTTATKIANLQGYMVFVRGDRGALNDPNPTILGTATNLRIKGKIRTGSQPFIILANKYQAIGNPFASQYNFPSTDKVNMVDGFITWNPGLVGLYGVGAYENYSKVGSDYRLNGQAMGAIRNTIESGQAIFIQNLTGSAGTFTVKESDKGTSSIMVSRGNTVDVDHSMLDISLYGKNSSGDYIFADGVSNGFGESFSAGIDNDDVTKFTNTYDNLFIKSANNILVVDKRPLPTVTDTIHLGITGTRIADYQLEMAPYLFENIWLDGYLLDKFLQKESAFWLSRPARFNFQITPDAASRNVDRFKIVFKAIPAANFLKISASRNADLTATVKWEMAAERIVEAYTVERSIDSVNFLPIVHQSALRNNGEDAGYESMDRGASKSKQFYRVKAITKSGLTSYSAIVAIEEVAEVKVYIYPNPAINGKFNLYLQHQPKGTYLLQIVNKGGQVVKTQSINVTSEKVLQEINMGAAAAGTYHLKLVKGDGSMEIVSFILK